MMRKCTMCGAMWGDEHVFCGKCGEKLPEELSGPVPETVFQDASEGFSLTSGSGTHDSASGENTAPENALRVSGDAPEQEQSPVAGMVPAEGDVFENTAPEDSGYIFCQKCGARLMSGTRRCVVCGMPAADNGRPVAAEEGSAPEPKGRKPFILALVACAVIILSMGTALVLSNLPGMFVPAPALSPEEAIIYVQKEDALKFKTSQTDKSQTITKSYDMETAYTDGIYDTMRLSRNNRYLAYLNDYRESEKWMMGKGDLYLRDLTVVTGDKLPPDKGEKIASDVTADFYFTPQDDHLIYLTRDGDLYITNFNETWKLDSDVKGIYDLNDTQVLYYKSDERSAYSTAYYTRRDVYVVSLGQSSRDTRQKVDTDISRMIEWSPDLNQFIYTKAQKQGVGNLYDVYAANLTGDTREELVGGVSQVIDQNLDDNSLVYLVTREEGLILTDILDDDLKESDFAIKEPKVSDFPLLNEYFGDFGDYFDYYYGYGDYDYKDYDSYGNYGYGDDGSTDDPYGYGNDYSTDDPYGYGNDYSTDDPYGYGDDYSTDDPYGYGDDYSTDDPYGYGDDGSNNDPYGYADPYSFGSGGTGYSDLMGEYERYMEAREQYEAKRMRDELRKRIASGTDMLGYDFTLYDLFVLQDGERKKIDTNIYRMGDDLFYTSSAVSADVKAGYAVYCKVNPTGINRLKMSELDSSLSRFTLSVQEYLKENLRAQLYFSDLNAAPVKIIREDEEEGLSGTYFVRPDAKGLYYFLVDRKSYTSRTRMYYVPIHDSGVPGEAVLVEGNMAHFYPYADDSGRLLYLANRSGDRCDLYTLDGDRTERIGFDVSYEAYSGFLDNGDVFYFFEHYNTGRGLGDLCLYINGEKVVVADDVYDFYYRSRDYMYLMRDWRGGKGDLYLWRNGSMELVDYDVTEVCDFYTGY